MQELRSHKRRNTKTGRKSLFAGLLYCPDCGAKLHFCAAKSLKLNQEFYRCANYNSGRGTCDIHYIRNVVLEQIVAEAVGSLADFVRCYESVFLYLLAKNNNVARQSEVQKLKQSLATSERRIKMIDKAIEELFEANISGKVSDERFVKMTDNYEKEQKELLELVADGNKKLQDAEHMSPTPEKLLNANESLLAKVICEAGNKGPKFGAEKAAKLREAAGSAQVIGVRSASNASLIKNVLDIIEGLLAAIQRIEREKKELVTQDTRLDEDVKLLCSIPGIGFSSAVVIAAEMGNISLFGKPKQLAAYFGLDPGERQSGTFKGRKSKLSKRGSPQVRAALHMAAVSSVSQNRDGTYRNTVLAEYYERKCAEKPCKVARVAVMRKLSNIIYAVLRDRRAFELRTPQEHMALLAAA